MAVSFNINIQVSHISSYIVLHYLKINNIALDNNNETLNIVSDYR